MGARNGSKAIDVSSRASAGRSRPGSPEFRRDLEAVVRAEVKEAAALPVRQLIDAAKIRAALGRVDPGVPRPAAVARIAVRINERLEKRLGVERRSVDEILDPDTRAEIDALLDDELPNPQALEEILAQIIRQKFVRRLFAELIHSAILAFNKRVNPFFGGITAAVLDDQIKAFIELGMPMLQEQAVAFALRPANQQFAVDLARSLIRGALAEPLRDLVPRASASQRRRIERLVARVLDSGRFHSAVGPALQRLWDDVYAEIRDKKLGQIVDAERLAEALVAPVTELAVAALSRPRIAEFLSRALR